MKRTIIATTALVCAGGMAAADVSVTGSAELGVKGGKEMKSQLHRDIRVDFTLSGSTDTGLSFGAKARLHEADEEGGIDGRRQAVHISGAFGTLTLGDTDGGFDKALTEVGSATSIADDHTSHPGYDENSGLDGGASLANNPGAILRYDYTIGGVTSSVSAEFGTTEGESDATYGVGVAWSGDMGGIGIDVGVGFQSGKGDVAVDMVDKVAMTYGTPQIASVTDAVDATYACQATSLTDGGATHPSITATATDDCSAPDGAVEDVEYTLVQLTPGSDEIPISHAVRGNPGSAEIAKSTDMHKASIAGASVKVDMGNGLSATANYSQKKHDITNSEDRHGGMRDSSTKITYTALGIAYTVGDLTLGVNGGSKTTKPVGGMAMKNSGVGAAVVYNLGTGASFQVGVGSGKEGNTKKSSWSAGLAFSF